MRKRDKILVAVVTVLMIGLVLFGTYMLASENEKDHLYATTGTVVYVCHDLDVVTFEDFNGNQWTFFGAEDWMVGDIASCVMSDNGTEAIKDDEIVSVRYSGYVKNER